MFVVAYSASNGSRYMRIVEARRRGGKVEHRHLLSLGPYEALSFACYRAILAEWKPLERAAVVLRELEEDSGRLQGRGYWRRFRRW
jgi:hypothetical protein